MSTNDALELLYSRRHFFSESEREAVETVFAAFTEVTPLRLAAAHLCAFDWESVTAPDSADLNARILALRAELDR